MAVTPRTLMTSVPAPRTSAPHIFKKLARSTTWGSLAQFSSTVWPSAMTAESMAFMVAPTLTLSKKMRAPCSFSLARTVIMP